MFCNDSRIDWVVQGGEITSITITTGRRGIDIQLLNADGSIKTEVTIAPNTTITRNIPKNKRVQEIVADVLTGSGMVTKTEFPFRIFW